MTNPPISRRLKVLSFDPSLTTLLETNLISAIVLNIPWEEDLQPGPVGQYIEVVDYDPASEIFYSPVDLNEINLIAQDGIQPSESDPHFHQQMVYAVAMYTIRNFERALGRVAFWSDRIARDENGQYIRQFVRRLRIYPHALRDRNAYYSPDKKALLFGYFPVTKKDIHNTPGTIVFTCLSHDIIAHEVAHALLDGVHPRFNEATNVDVHAFHEAFADIVAIFQHFTYPTVLENQIAKTRGKLHTENLLSQLAQQFGRAVGRGSSLRDALGKINEQTGEWEESIPDPHELEKTYDPHVRGAILVAAVFRAFLLIYRAQSEDLYRIATQGTGTLPDGDIHPDLTKRLAREASKCADRVLQMCIRAIDYCPPVNITFGDFLRGVITADYDYAPEDENSYRIVFIQSFREWGIHPRGITNTGMDSLFWLKGEELIDNLLGSDKEDRKSEMRESMKTSFLPSTEVAWNLENDRYKIWKSLDRLKYKIWNWLIEGDSVGREYAKVFGLAIDEAKPTVFRNKEGEPAIEIHSVRPAIRQTIRGSTRTDYVIEITQRRRGYFDPKVQERMDQRTTPLRAGEYGDFIYRAGCTILIDQSTQELRWVIPTAGTINDDEELERVRNFLIGEDQLNASNNAFDSGINRHFSGDYSIDRDEPFAALHQKLND